MVNQEFTCEAIARSTTTPSVIAMALGLAVLLGDDVRPQHGLAADLAVGDREHWAETSGSVSYRRRDVTGLHRRGLRWAAGVEARPPTGVASYVF
jgi:hypothetical protein